MANGEAAVRRRTRWDGTIWNASPAAMCSFARSTAATKPSRVISASAVPAATGSAGGAGRGRGGGRAGAAGGGEGGGGPGWGSSQKKSPPADGRRGRLRSADAVAELAGRTSLASPPPVSAGRHFGPDYAASLPPSSS